MVNYILLIGLANMLVAEETLNQKDKSFALFVKKKNVNKNILIFFNFISKILG